MPALRGTPASPAIASRLVLALDGVDYRDVMAARERGLFAAFRTPSRLVSTFPSISDIAWHDIFGVLPPRGYQRIYYSNAQNAIIGNALDAIKPIEYEERMDLAFGTKLHHLGAYLMSGTVSRREVNVAVDRFFDIHGREAVYVYNVGPDALQHTRGDLAAYLAHLDKRLVELQREYRSRTGRELEIAVLSDHGHNRGSDAKFLPLVEALEAHGYRAASSIGTTRDVAFSVDGVTTGFGVFAKPSVVDSVAAAIAAIEGVDVVTVRESDVRFRVLSARGEATIDVRPDEFGGAFRYTPLTGDPLWYRGVADSLRVAGTMDSAGYAPDAAWRAATFGLRFPVALSRIVRGHTTVTLNPAPILVSLADGYRVGLGMVSIANRMRPLGGTHGALSETNSLGVVMTNFVDTHDDDTRNVREQVGGMGNLRSIERRDTGARLTTSMLVARDRFSSFIARPGSEESAKRPTVELWLSESHRKWVGDGGLVRLDLRQGGARAISALIASEEWPVPGPIPSRSPRELLLQMSGFDAIQLVPLSTYHVRVVLLRAPTDPNGGLRESKDVLTIPLRTDAMGRIAAY